MHLHGINAEEQLGRDLMVRRRTRKTRFVPVRATQGDQYAALSVSQVQLGPIAGGHRLARPSRHGGVEREHRATDSYAVTVTQPAATIDAVPVHVGTVGRETIVHDRPLPSYRLA